MTEEMTQLGLTEQALDSAAWRWMVRDCQKSTQSRSSSSHSYILYVAMENDLHVSLISDDILRTACQPPFSIYTQNAILSEPSNFQYLIHLEPMFMCTRRIFLQISSAVRQRHTVPVVMGGVEHPRSGTALKEYLLHRSGRHYGNLQRVDWLKKQMNHIKDYTEMKTRKLNKSFPSRSSVS